MTDVFGAEQLASWADRGGELLEASRASIDALNVFPVPDGDTGTNLCLTWQAATDALNASSVAGSPEASASLAEAATRWSRAALLGARGNSGVIMAQLLRGMAGTFVEHAARSGHSGLDPESSARVLVAGLTRAVELGYAGVARPVEGTILTVASAAANAATNAVAEGLLPMVGAAVEAAADALARTPQQLAVLARAGVVDAGAQGWVLVLEGLRAAVDPAAPSVATVLATYGLDQLVVAGMDRPGGGVIDGAADMTADGAFEVMYLLEGEDAAAGVLRNQLDEIGASVVVVGGDGLWNVHVHTDDAGPAVEAGVAAGRVFRIRITPLTDARYDTHDHLGEALDRVPVSGAAPSLPATASLAAPLVAPLAAPLAAAVGRRSVVAVASGLGSGSLFSAGGANVVAAGAGRRPTPKDLVAAAGDATEVLLLPNDDDHHAAAEAAADELRALGVQATVLPTHAEVQGLAALAVHDAGRSLTDDIVAMSAAAGSTRFGALSRAEREAMTSAGICRPGQILGLIDGDIALIGDSPDDVARALTDRMLSAGGELVTLLCADDPLPGGPVAEAVREHLHQTRRDVEVVVYDGGQAHYPLLIGVE
jgi:DAK2 domain fusion protein YloV